MDVEAWRSSHTLSTYLSRGLSIPEAFASVASELQGLTDSHSGITVDIIVRGIIPKLTEILSLVKDALGENTCSVESPMIPADDPRWGKQWPMVQQGLTLALQIDPDMPSHDVCSTLHCYLTLLHVFGQSIVRGDSPLPITALLRCEIELHECLRRCVSDSAYRTGVEDPTLAMLCDIVDYTVQYLCDEEMTLPASVSGPLSYGRWVECFRSSPDIVSRFLTPLTRILQEVMNCMTACGEEAPMAVRDLFRVLQDAFGADSVALQSDGGIE